jgi:hypothetical protein
MTGPRAYNTGEAASTAMASLGGRRARRWGCMRSWLVPCALGDTASAPT